MAGKKAATILVKLLSSAGTGFFYLVSTAVPFMTAATVRACPCATASMVTIPFLTAAGEEEP